MDCEYPIGFLYLVCKERERKHEKMEKVYGNRFGSIYEAYKQEKYASFGELNYADASRQAVKDMIEDISSALNNR